MTWTRALAILVRHVVREALGLPANTVRPANQSVPAGAQDEVRVTVQVISDSSQGRPQRKYTVQGNGLLETQFSPQRFTASVNIMRAGVRADAAGLANYSAEAFDYARRLPNILVMSASTELLTKYGLGFIRASPARDLSSLFDGSFEARDGLRLDLIQCTNEHTILPTGGDVHHEASSVIGERDRN